MLTDSQIMLEVQRGRIELFEQLVARHRPRMLRFAASKLGDPAAAEDCVQDAFLAVYTARQNYRPEFAVSTWAYTILLNLCRRYSRRQARRHAGHLGAAPLDGLTGSAASPLSVMLAAERREQLHAWLDTLPEAEADALRLRFFSELSFEEIAAAMESSVSGAKVRVRRGLQRLVKLVDEASDGKPPSARGPATKAQAGQWERLR